MQQRRGAPATLGLPRAPPPRLHCPHSPLWWVGCRHELRDALNYCCLAHACLADEQRVVLGAAQQDLVCRVRRGCVRDRVVEVEVASVQLAAQSAVVARVAGIASAGCYSYFCSTLHAPP
jgi:hypothetical protein